MQAAVDWRPSGNRPAQADGLMAEAAAAAAAASAAAAGGGGGGDGHGGVGGGGGAVRHAARPIRVFAFGMPTARRKVRMAFHEDWDPRFDWFVA